MFIQLFNDIKVNILLVAESVLCVHLIVPRCV